MMDDEQYLEKDNDFDDSNMISPSLANRSVNAARKTPQNRDFSINKS